VALLVFEYYVAIYKAPIAPPVEGCDTMPADGSARAGDKESEKQGVKRNRNRDEIRVI
jgi:hypothetical protein